MKMLLLNKKHILQPGPTGTGKSVNTETLLGTQMPENYASIGLTFSAQTSANQTQDLIDGKVTKRSRDVFGPPSGKYFILFVDDLNMPKKEEFGAQPPIELLRQWLDHDGWYDRKTKQFRKLTDIVMISAMGPPGGGRQQITNRIVRHFNIISYTTMEEDDIKKIFIRILNTFLKDFTDEVKNEIGCIIESTIDIYNVISQELLPTPTKSHYTFNLRDIAKVFQGVTSSHSKVLNTKILLVRLWCHEIKRVFGDRLISQEDRDWLQKLLDEKSKQFFKVSPEAVFQHERLIFGDFMSQSLDKPYGEVNDMKKMLSMIEEYLEQYNGKFIKKQMKLVMFLDACEHVSRICRVLRQPQGHALLLGVGGSGRQSLSRLAAYISECDCFQIEVIKNYSMKSWRDDLKGCLKHAAKTNEPYVFLFCDTQIINEQMLEDLNNVLNSGDVPNIYKTEDQEDIIAIGRPECQRKSLQLNELNMFQQYVKRVKKNIHIMIAMSPVGNTFRTRLRMYPSLINCCTIDWFTDWPEEALISVAYGALNEEDLNLEENQAKIINMFSIIHKTVEHESINFKNELRRINYVTPTSYLELLNLFKAVLKDKRIELNRLRSRLQNGLDKLQSAEQEVIDMKKKIEVMRPELADAKEKAKNAKEKIAVEQISAEETQKEVAQEEAVASKQAAEVESIQKQAQGQLDEALPALDRALDSVKKLQIKQLVEVKTFTTPPEKVKLTMEVVCIYFEKKPVRKTDQQTMKKYDDYWETAQKQVLNDPKSFLANLIGYKKEEITEELIKKVEKYIQSPDFTPESIRATSQACEAICMWAHAMYNFYHVNRQVEPLREKLKIVNAQLEKSMGVLKIAQAKLKEVNDRIAGLQANYDEMVKKEENLQAQLQDCEIKLERAHKLLGGLGGEQIRWNKEVDGFTESLILLPGDSLIASGMLAYSGPFTSGYRQKFELNWRSQLKQKQIPHTGEISMLKLLGDAVKIRTWNMCKLPNDSVSVENGIILDKARRWALMIDPQNIANIFIKQLGRETNDAGIECGKLSDSNLIRNLANAIPIGKWFLLQNVGQELDAMLEPLLTQQIQKEGSSYVIQLGDKIIDYDQQFRFFMTTTLPNPHYPPETQVKVTILNFAITPEGLEEQMLGKVVQSEKPHLEEMKSNLVMQMYHQRNELERLENEILENLSQQEGNILDNETLINALSDSKKMAIDIQQKVAEAKQAEQEIDNDRMNYRPVAFRGSILFFTLMDLSNIDPMYQYSLQ